MRSIILITALLLAQSGRAELLNAQQLQQLNQKIEKTGGDWHAERNHMTVLSKEEVRYRLGLHREGAVEAQFASNNTRMLADLPAQLDWRNKDGKNWVSPILDQANCGSCVAFASIGVLETQYKISSLIPDFNARFSAQNLFSCGGGYCNWGWQPDSAAEFLQRTGVPDEACMPYSSGATGKDVSCRVSCPDTSTRSVKITSYTQPTSGSQDLQAVKQALQKGPLVTTLSVYADFMAYAGGVYKHTSGEMMGGHAVSIVGYDDTMSAFIVRNSWGEEWGDKGFVYVSYDDESGIGDETWLYNMPSMAGGVSIETPNDYSYYTGTAAVKAVSSYQATDSMTLAVFNGQNQAVANVS
ncbi:MAG TPA: C1 family peptidase, partial [Bdellovibrio sp.]|nr:C1 family peptidase [Bdellovibrio sp.]